MNKKNNFLNNKKNGNNRNNNTHNGHQGFQGGRGGGNHINHRINHWNNERVLMQRICDGAIVTLLSNAIAAATSLNTLKNNNELQTNTSATPPLTKEDSVLHKEKDETKQEESFSPSKENAQDNTDQTKRCCRLLSGQNLCRYHQIFTLISFLSFSRTKLRKY